MKKFIFSLVILCLALGCTACGENKDTQKSNMAFILGITNNNPVFESSIDEIKSLAEYADSHYSIIMADGEPNLLFQDVVPNFQERHLTKTMLERAQKGVQEDIIGKIAEASPDNSETDIASSLELGARTLRGESTDGISNTMVICHSGISTTGSINMIDTPISTMDIDKSVEQLSTNLDINLNDIDVIWYYLAEGRGNQHGLNSQEKSKLKDFYYKLLTMLGAHSVIFKENLASSETYNFPERPVSCMPTEGNQSQLVETVQADTITDSDAVADILDKGKALSFNENDIEFEPGTSKFLDENLAKNSISNIVEYIRNNNDASLLICGSCAGDEGVDVDRSYVLQLSLERAEAVKKMICDELQISGETLQVKGLGATGPFHISGMGLGAEASVNRNVTFLKADSKEAIEIIDNY